MDTYRNASGPNDDVITSEHHYAKVIEYKQPTLHYPDVVIKEMFLQPKRNISRPIIFDKHHVYSGVQGQSKDNFFKDN